MSKSTKNLVREILIAQGVTGVDPTPAAVAILERITDAVYDAAYSAGASDATLDLEG